MEDVWGRIIKEIETRPDGKGRPVTWLVNKLGYSLSRVKNWPTRGVPVREHEAIAKALGWSVDAVAGRESPPKEPWPFEDVSRDRFDRLTERQKGAVESAMLEVIGRIEAAKVGSEKPPGSLGGMSNLYTFSPLRRNGKGTLHAHPAGEVVSIDRSWGLF